MNVRTPFFLGAGLGTCLGGTVSRCIKMLRELPQDPQSIECCLIDRVETIPYKLLDGVGLENKDQRIYNVINQVIVQAIDEAELTIEQQHNMALFVGSSSFDISVSEYLYQQELKQSSHPLPLRLSSFGNIASYIRTRFSLFGPDYSFNTACTSSANALLAAGSMLRQGVFEHALVVGLEFYNDTTTLGFHNLELLTSSSMKPFDQHRNGLVLGEACSAVVLGCDKSQLKRANPFFLVGGASQCDTHSISATNPDGSSIAEVIELALANTGFAASAMNAIKVHGTASLSNDEAEIEGILAVFERPPRLSALKPFIGHTLGACGLTELVLFFRAIEAGFLPATPGIGGDHNGMRLKLNQHYNAPEEGAFMLNYFGFGGNNCSVIIANK